MPARMMSIADIILESDVKRGSLDAELFGVFVGARVWEQRPA